MEELKIGCAGCDEDYTKEELEEVRYVLGDKSMFSVWVCSTCKEKLMEDLAKFKEMPDDAL